LNESGYLSTLGQVSHLWSYPDYQRVNFWDLAEGQLIESLESCPEGLSDNDALHRRDPRDELKAVNEVWWRVLLRQFTSPITLILIVAAAISVIVSDPIDGIIIIIIIGVSSGLGFLQEHRAALSMAELLGRVQVHADVIRSGQEREVLLSDVVLGDIVLLHPGDVVPADIRIFESNRLLVDESSLTGEYNTVEKTHRASTTPEMGLPLNGVFLGSHIVSGSGRGVAVAVGASARFGRLIASLDGNAIQTQFERQITSFGYFLARIVTVLVIAIMLISAIAQRPLLESLMFALAIAVGITPQLLPAIVTVSLSRGAQRMASAHVLVKRLDAIEDIGAMNILCCDKTGTLTRGVVALERTCNVNGQPDDRVLRLAIANAGLQRGFPNSLDKAILIDQLPTEAVLIDEVPYDFDRRRLSVLAHMDRVETLITKGAFASVISQCTKVRVNSRVDTFDPVSRHSVDQMFEMLSNEGFRVLAIATREMDNHTHATVEDEQELIFEGLLAFSDPPTEEARKAISQLDSLNVDVVLITGDNRHVARHVSSAVGLPTSRIVTGSDLNHMSEQEIQEVVASVRVFAEVDPAQKETLVSSLRRAGATVGYLGDGINDAAALRVADAGFSVDGAADAAKHAASLVLMTKDLDVLAEGIRAGRRTFANTLKYVRVTISANFGNMFSLVVAAIFLPFLPLLPLQILLLNLLSDVPALTIASDRVDPEIEERPRTWELDRLRSFMIVFGLASSVIDLSAFAIFTLVLKLDVSSFHSSWFLLSLLTECLALLVLRTGRPLLRSAPSKWLVTSIIFISLIGILLVGVGVGVLGFSQPGVSASIVIALLAVTYVLLNESLKVLWNRRLGWRGI
jgi:Mg2+-importing ATPase